MKEESEAGKYPLSHWTQLMFFSFFLIYHLSQLSLISWHCTRVCVCVCIIFLYRFVMCTKFLMIYECVIVVSTSILLLFFKINKSFWEFQQDMGKLNLALEISEDLASNG